MHRHLKTLAALSLMLSLFSAAVAHVNAAAAPASGSYTTLSGLVNVLAFPSSSERASAFQIGLGQTTPTEISYTDNALRADDATTPVDESLNEMWAFCVQPYELDTSGNPTLTPAEFFVNGDHTLVTDKILNAHNSKPVRYLMNKVPLYAKNGSLGAAPPIGLLVDRSSTAYVGTPVSSTATVTVGASTITVSSRDLEYAAVSLAVRKILDPALNLDNIDPSLKGVLKPRAEEYIAAAAANAAAFVEPDAKNSYGASISTLVANGSLTVTVTGLDGVSGSEIPLAGKTVRLWNQSADLDSAAGVQNQVSSVTGSDGKVVFALPTLSASTAAKVVVEKAIAPGTLVKTTGQVTAPPGSTTTTPAKAQQQMLATAGWARVTADVTLPQSPASTTVASSTTAVQTTTSVATTDPGTSLPGTGPDYSRLYLFVAAVLGFSGIYLSKRREVTHK